MCIFILNNNKIEAIEFSYTQLICFFFYWKLFKGPYQFKYLTLNFDFVRFSIRPQIHTFKESNC